MFYVYRIPGSLETAMIMNYCKALESITNNRVLKIFRGKIGIFII
jgi:hypothetical protein